MRLTINIVGLTAGWWACILGASGGWVWFGPAVVAVHLALHVRGSQDRKSTATFLALATAVGLILDSALSAAGLLFFTAPNPVVWISPLWMVALWPNFATSLNVSLEFLQEGLILSALIGAIGGPFAYWGGSQLGAIQMVPNALVWIAIEWAIATPLLAFLARATETTPENTVGQAVTT